MNVRHFGAGGRGIRQRRVGIAAQIDAKQRLGEVFGDVVGGILDARFPVIGHMPGAQLILQLGLVTNVMGKRPWFEFTP